MPVLLLVMSGLLAKGHRQRLLVAITFKLVHPCHEAVLRSAK